MSAPESHPHQVCGDPLCIELDDTKVCVVYLDRLNERVPADQVAAQLARVEAMRDAARPVATAARAALERMQSDHAGAPLLKAIAQRLCQDIDEAERVPDRIAATRTVVQLLGVLDGALFASTRVPEVAGDDGAPDPEGGTDSDDPFEIGDVPPGVGDQTP